MLSFKSFLKRILVCFGLILSGLLLFYITSAAQNCDPNEIAKISGIWKAGLAGSIHNVTSVNLAKEKEVLSSIHKMLTSKFSPVGLEVNYSNSFGYNIYEGRNWTADPYIYNLYLLRYRCGTSKHNTRNYQPDISSSTSVYFAVNKIPGIDINAADLAEDHDPGYIEIKNWPEKKDGFWFWPRSENREGKSIQKTVQYLVTYDDKLPFRAMTKKEYIAIKVPFLRKYLEQLEGILKGIDPTIDESSKEDFQYRKKQIIKQKALIDELQGMVESWPPEKLQEPAIIDAGQSWYEFLGFKKEGDTYINHLIIPDLNYFNKNLPKWVPQFICITIANNYSDEVYTQNIDALHESIDFLFLKSMLGK